MGSESGLELTADTDEALGLPAGAAEAEEALGATVEILGVERMLELEEVVTVDFVEAAVVAVVGSLVTTK